jgi:hypothetical protein
MKLGAISKSYRVFKCVVASVYGINEDGQDKDNFIDKINYKDISLKL